MTASAYGVICAFFPRFLSQFRPVDGHSVRTGALHALFLAAERRDSWTCCRRPSARPCCPSRPPACCHLLGLALGSAFGRLGEARRRRHVGRTQQRQSRVPDGDAEDPRGNPERRSGERLGTTILVEDRHGARYTLTAPGAKYLAPRKPTRATNTAI